MIPTEGFLKEGKSGGDILAKKPTIKYLPLMRNSGEITDKKRWWSA